jgi:hypothetical protein
MGDSGTAGAAIKVDVGFHDGQSSEPKFSPIKTYSDDGTGMGEKEGGKEKAKQACQCFIEEYVVFLKSRDSTSWLFSVCDSEDWRYNGGFKNKLVWVAFSVYSFGVTALCWYWFELTQTDDPNDKVKCEGYEDEKCPEWIPYTYFWIMTTLAKEITVILTALPCLKLMCSNEEGRVLEVGGFKFLPRNMEYYPQTMDDHVNQQCDGKLVSKMENDRWFKWFLRAWIFAWSCLLAILPFSIVAEVGGNDILKLVGMWLLTELVTDFIIWYIVTSVLNSIWCTQENNRLINRHKHLKKARRKIRAKTHAEAEEAGEEQLPNAILMCNGGGCCCCGV